MRFADITGLEEEKQRLIRAVEQDHVAHAQMLLGPEGSGKLALAWAYIAYLNCENRQAEDSCGQCAACRKIDQLAHPDVHFVFPVSATKNVKGKDVISASYMKEWREFVRRNPYGELSDWSHAFGAENKQLNISREESRHIVRNLSLKAFEGRYKIMLIWRPEYMHVTAANALLKILEEPPERTVFIMVAQDAEKLLATIISRVQIMQVRAFSDEEITQELTQKLKTPEAQAAQLAHLAEGNLREAFRLTENVEDDTHKMFHDWMRLCYTWDFTQLMLWSERFHKMSKASQQSLLQYGLNMLRETLLAHYDDGTLSRLKGEEQAFVSNFSKVVSPTKLDLMVTAITESAYHLERNASPKILFTDLSLQLAKILRR